MFLTCLTLANIAFMAGNEYCYGPFGHVCICTYSLSQHGERGREHKRAKKICFFISHIRSQNHQIIWYSNFPNKAGNRRNLEQILVIFQCITCNHYFSYIIFVGEFHAQDCVSETRFSLFIAGTSTHSATMAM